MKWQSRLANDVRKKFHVHEGPLRQHSQWFSDRMNRKWEDPNHVELADEESNTFTLFAEHMYHN